MPDLKPTTLYPGSLLARQASIAVFGCGSVGTDTTVAGIPTDFRFHGRSGRHRGGPSDP